MMLKRGVNLIPAARRDIKRRRCRVRFWAKMCVMYAALWLGAFAVSDLVAAGDDRALRLERDQTLLDVDAANKAIASMRDRIGAGRSRLQASLEVGEQPDWSLLLALLSSTLGDEAVLRSVRLGVPTDALDKKPAAAAAAEARRVTLDLVGFAQTQKVVTELVLRLEQTPLFERVRLIDTRREPFRSGTAVGFRIECVLGAREEG
jgi:hypothetical protein